MDIYKVNIYFIPRAIKKQLRIYGAIISDNKKKWLNEIKNDLFVNLYYNGNIFDLNSVIFSTYNQILISSLSKGKIKKNSIKVISCLNDTKVFIYNDKSLIECFGICQISYLLNICLNYYISQDLIFSK